MYIETSGGNHGSNIFCSFERRDIIQISIITFYYNSYTILTDDSLKSMGRFEIQLFLKMILGLLKKQYLKKVNIVILQLVGQY